jgi:hypothetical protein
MQKNTPENLQVTITPIDAISTNRETFEAANRDGNYEKELTFDLEKQMDELKKISKEEASEIAAKINGVNAVSKLERNGLISPTAAYQLKMRISYGEEYGRDGTETSILSESEIYPDNFNPYKINNKYLSVFKVTFDNKSDKVERIKLKAIQVVSGEELLFPLGMEYFESNLKNEPEKIKNAYRMNMPEELILTPGQRITKYISVPALNTNNEKLLIQMIGTENITNFDFSVKVQTSNKDYQVESYDIVTSTLPSPGNTNFRAAPFVNYYAVSYRNGASYATTDNRIFVSDENKNSIASVYVIAINKYSSMAIPLYKTNFKFSELSNNRIVVNNDSTNK